MFNLKSGRRAFSSGKHTVCVVACGQSADIKAARIFNGLEKMGKAQDINLVGVGGPKLAEHGLNKSLLDIDAFPDKAWVPFRRTRNDNYYDSDWLKRYNPFLYSTFHKHNNALLKQIDENDLTKEIYRHRPSAVLTVNNEKFSYDFYDRLNANYKGRVQKPARVHFDRFVHNLDSSFENKYDHLIYTVPKPRKDWNDYVFPSTYIGQTGVADAWSFLYSRSDKYKHLLTDSSIFIRKEFQHELISELVAEERRRYRETNNIDDTKNLIFISAGNKKSELEWSLPIINETIDEFLQVFTKPTSESTYAVDRDAIEVVFSVESGSGQQVKNFVQGHKWGCKVRIVSSPEDRFSAMAASDMAMAYNGDAASELAAMQVPTAILAYLDKTRFYWMQVYDRNIANINIMSGGHGFPEIIEGQANKLKLTDVLGGWFISPKEKFEYMRLYEAPLYKSFALKASDSIKSTDLVQVTEEYDEFYLPDYLAAKAFWDLLSKYPEEYRSDFAGFGAAPGAGA